MRNKRRKNTSLIEEDPDRVIKEVVDVLNNGPKANDRLTSAEHERLARIVQAWKVSGPDLFKMKVAQCDRATLPELEKAFEFHLAPTHSGRAYVFTSPTGPNFRDIPAVYFVRLITCEKWDFLGGPCPNCHRWFKKKTRRSDNYWCSTGCGGNKRQARRRERLREKKLERAKQAIGNYSNRPARLRNYTWKKFVSEAIGVSKNWLQHQVTLGRLRPPQEIAITERK